MPDTTRHAVGRYLIASVAFTAALLIAGCASSGRPPAPAQAPSAGERFVRRAFDPVMDGRWIGNAIAYGPHRDGQAPGQQDPSRDELLEDLRRIARHWHLLRVYGSTGPTPAILSLIREHRLPLRIMLGVWLAPEDRRDSTGAVIESFPDVRRANQDQVESAVRLARRYEDIVMAINAGNETQVFWSAHRLPAAQLLRDIRAIRNRTHQPITTADDYNFWNKPESRAIAAEIDFITMHAHPLWNGKLLAEAFDWTVDTYASIRAAHPGHPLVLGETGWATRVHNEGEQARLIQGEAGEEQQRVFYEAIATWAQRTQTTLFYFEAFDENWKGGPHPNEVEKHWGLYRADRTPKAAMDGRP